LTSARVVSLLEILRVYADGFVQVTRHLAQSIGILDGDNIWEDEEHRTFLVIRLKELRNICRESELPVTLALVEKTLRNFEMNDDQNVSDEEKLLIRKNTTNDLMKHYLFNAIDRFQDELSTKIFFQLPHSRKSYFDAPFLGWENIVKRFPDCVRDVEEMNKCYARCGMGSDRPW